MRICVIFNPTARGGKAQRFLRVLDSIGRQCELKATVSAGHARVLAAEAVRDGCGTVVAAGGDGTLNEVLNGLGDVPDGFARARLGLLPLGTINVFARELGLPLRIMPAWKIILAGKEALVDLPRAEFTAGGRIERRYFAQLGGAGLDSRSISLVSWEAKKKLGILAYLAAGLKALRGPQSLIHVVSGNEPPPEGLASSHGLLRPPKVGRTILSAIPEDRAPSPGVAQPRQGEPAPADPEFLIYKFDLSSPNSLRGELVLLGNGRYYGGPFCFFRDAHLRDGRLHVCLFPKVSAGVLCRGILGMMTGRFHAAVGAREMSADSVTLSSPGQVQLELDGDNAGELPAKFTISPKTLRVIVPE
jgi:diacylglycerol kinase family enzyme